jgi:hypothetical protein
MEYFFRLWRFGKGVLAFSFFFITQMVLTASRCDGANYDFEQFGLFNK